MEKNPNKADADVHIDVPLIDAANTANEEERSDSFIRRSTFIPTPENDYSLDEQALIDMGFDSGMVRKVYLFLKPNNINEAISIMVKFLLIPVGVGYFIYRAYYFYSSETSLFNFIIEYIFFLFGVFGFILMTPQIYLNYKLKSVDHFPFKIMIFKFLDTIVDDLEIFALKSPTLYRIFCFKDDVIFVIYLYQLFKYKDNRLVDVAKRIEQEEKEKEAAKDKKDN